MKSHQAKKYPVTQKSRTFVSDALQKTDHYTVCFLNSSEQFFAGINLLLNKKKSFKGNSLQADSYSNIILVCVPDLQMLPAEHSIMGRGHTA